MKKFHPLRKECIADLRMVFRDPTDKGKERKKSTPTSTVLLENMKVFERNWKPACFDGIPVLNDKVSTEISNLKKHINNSCLSSIKPGRGTNRNENLHKKLWTLQGMEWNWLMPYLQHSSTGIIRKLKAMM